MAASLTLFPGSTIRWHDRRFVILDYAGLDAIIAREPGKRRLERIPVNEAEPDHSTNAAWATPDLVSVPEKEWREALKKFKIVKPLLNSSSPLFGQSCYLAAACFSSFCIIGWCARPMFFSAGAPKSSGCK
jgi:hypothetical protein